MTNLRLTLFSPDAKLLAHLLSPPISPSLDATTTIFFSFFLGVIPQKYFVEQSSVGDSGSVGSDLQDKIVHVNKKTVRKEEFMKMKPFVVLSLFLFESVCSQRDTGSSNVFKAEASISFNSEILPYFQISLNSFEKLHKNLRLIWYSYSYKALP